MKIGFVSLGCPKNQLDTEVMLHEVLQAGYEITPEETEADIVIINTCAFIESAKQEAIDNILDIAWLKKHNKLEWFGLCKPTASAKAFLFYIPLIVLTSKNLWGGAAMHYDAPGTVCFIVKMLCVGFLEELIFRGFLFKAMSRDSIKWAVIVSSVTFGLGHIINLINGSGMGLAENLVQIFFAVLIGFLYVIIFWRGGSLWPCVISHGAFNSLSAFSVDGEAIGRLVILCVLTVAYALILLKTLPRSEANKALY